MGFSLVSYPRVFNVFIWAVYPPCTKSVFQGSFHWNSPRFIISWPGSSSVIHRKSAITPDCKMSWLSTDSDPRWVRAFIFPFARLQPGFPSQWDSRAAEFCPSNTCRRLWQQVINKYYWVTWSPSAPFTKTPHVFWGEMLPHHLNKDT